MHTGVISFCDRIAFNIKSTDAKDVILNALHSKFNITILQRHWFRLDEKNKDHIARSPHLMMLRSNGNPYYLYMTQYDDVNQLMFIDKKVQPGYEKPRIIMVRGQFNDALFAGTLLEGEMVKDAQGQWIFLINDVIGYKGHFLERETYPQRLGKAYQLLKQEYRPDALMDVCQFHVKKVFPATQAHWETLLALNESLSYTNRGIYLWPFHLKYKPKLMNFDDSLIKKVVRKVKDDPTFRESVVEPPLSSLSQPPSHSPSPPLPQPSAQPRPPPPSHSAQPRPPSSQSTPQTESRVLYLRKTENPDVYQVFAEDYAKTKMGVAHIPTLALSKQIRAVFKDLNVVSSVPFQCQWNPTFEKWAPLRTYSAQ